MNTVESDLITPACARLTRGITRLYTVIFVLIAVILLAAAAITNDTFLVGISVCILVGWGVVSALLSCALKIPGCVRVFKKFGTWLAGD